MIRVVLVGLFGALVTGGGMALYERDLLRPALEPVGLIGIPITLGVLIHPVVGVTAGLIALEGLYEATQTDLLEERKRQYRTLWRQLQADARRARKRIRHRIETWRTADEEGSS